MPRYFFDAHESGRIDVDELGTEFATMEEVKDAAMKLLPDLARELAPKAGENYSYVVLVRNENGRSVFSATLNVTGLWLTPRQA